jgi:methylglutaconyl-CoA hydratase
MGSRQARRYMISGERFSALEALRLGLVHEVVAAERLDDRVSEMVEVLLANGPLAMAAAKDLIHCVARGPLDAAMIADTAERIAAIRASAEGREGVGAFLDKRRPAWTER